MPNTSAKEQKSKDVLQDPQIQDRGVCSALVSLHEPPLHQVSFAKWDLNNSVIKQYQYMILHD